LDNGFTHLAVRTNNKSLDHDLFPFKLTGHIFSNLHTISVALPYEQLFVVHIVWIKISMIFKILLPDLSNSHDILHLKYGKTASFNKKWASNIGNMNCTLIIWIIFDTVDEMDFFNDQYRGFVLHFT